MDLNKKRVVIELEPRTLLPLREAAGAVVTCLEGVLWITQEDDRNDVVLEKGDTFVVRHGGSTLVQPLHGARIAIEAAQPRLAHELRAGTWAERHGQRAPFRGSLTEAVLSLLGLSPRVRAR